MKACGKVEALLQALLNSATHWGELHALATSPPVKKNQYTLCIGGWVEDSLDNLKKRKEKKKKKKLLPLPDTEPCVLFSHPSCSLVTTASELAIPVPPSLEWFSHNQILIN